MDTNEARLTAFVLGELEEAEREVLTAELEASPELQREVAAIRESVDLLVRGLQAEPCPALTDEQRAAIGQNDAGKQADLASLSPLERETARRRVWPLLAAAACVLLASVIFPQFGGRSQRVARTTTHSPAAEESEQRQFESSDESAQFLGRTSGSDHKDRDLDRTAGVQDASGESEPAASPRSDSRTVNQSGVRGPASGAAGGRGGFLGDRGLEGSARPDGMMRQMEATEEAVDGKDATVRQGFGIDDGRQLGGGGGGSISGGGAAGAGGSLGGGVTEFEAIDDALQAAAEQPAPGRLFGDRLGGAAGRGVQASEPPATERLDLNKNRALGAAQERLRDRGLAGDSATEKPQVGATRSGGAWRGFGYDSPAPAGQDADDRAIPDQNEAEHRSAAAAVEMKTQEAELEAARRAESLSRMEREAERAGERAAREKTARQQVEARSRDVGALGTGRPAVGLRAAGQRSASRSSQALTPGGEARGDDMDGGQTANESAPASPAAAPTSSSKQIARPSWRRVRATPNASRLMVGDRDELALEGMQVNVLVDGFRARVLLDMYYFNDRARRLEGNFKLRLPNDASLYYFAFGESAYEYRPQVDQLAAKGFLSAELVRAASLNPAGIRRAREPSWNNVKEARLVPRAKAAHAYGETVRRRVDPALVEWSGAGVFNARVFPLMPGKLHRIVVGYDVTLQQGEDQLSYRLDLPEGSPECFVDLNVAAVPGMTAEVSPHAQPFLASGRAYYRFANPDSASIEVKLLQPGQVLLAGSDEAAGDFFATRFIPALPADETVAGARRAVFILDTSLSSRPDRFNIWLQLLEQILARNQDSIREFAVLFFNIECHWWQERFVENTPAQVNRLLADCHSLSLEGATDLRQALREASRPGWLRSRGEVHDRFLLSDGAATWGETELPRIAAAMPGSGALFAYRVGTSGTATSTLDYLARRTGGAVFAVPSESEIPIAARAHRRRPWRLLELNAPGGSDLLVAGRPQFVYPGQPLLVVGRGAVDGEIAVRLRRGKEERTATTRLDQVIQSELSARLYGQIAVGQLEDLGTELRDVAVAYARHFRVTGRSCSLLMLESEADYRRFQIKPADDAFVVRSSPAAELLVERISALAERLTDAKATLTSWLAELESTPGMQCKLPTALRLAIDRLPQRSFEVDPERLVVKQRERAGLAKKYSAQLDSQTIDYDVISQQAARRFEQHGAADALRTLSNLIENNPGDPVLTRDVAFSAISWGLPAHAYPLLQRVAKVRPYEPQTYQAMAHCLAQAGHADLAMIYYEIALNGQWHERYRDINQIAAMEYLELLQRIRQGQLTSQVPDYAHARLDSLAEQVPVARADLVVTMMWNTDRTDVDLHVLEPTGEECYYEHPRTRIGGQITRDVTQGFGPEMYTLVNAQPGRYQIAATYFGSDRNRTKVRSKVYVTIYEHFGSPQQQTSRRTITLSDTKEKRELAAVQVKN